MSARAASRLSTLGFRHIYRYQPGKADWFAAGLPREGDEADTPRVADLTHRNVPTCRLDERVSTVRNRVRDAGWDVCVTVDEQRVVLGMVRAEALGVGGDMPIEQVMQPGPVTVRPNLAAGQMPDYLRRQRAPRALVTTSDGVLIGLIRMEDVGSERGHVSS